MMQCYPDTLVMDMQLMINAYHKRIVNDYYYILLKFNAIVRQGRVYMVGCNFKEYSIVF